MTNRKNKKQRCYTYIRVSTEMQVEGYSLEAQKDRLIKFADYQGMEIIREYCDAGKSGKSIAGRPEFTQMLQDVADERDDVDYILVFKLSRFGRNAADVLNSLQQIQDYGVNLICVEDGIDSSKDSGKLTITVLSAVAEIERENILVQTMEGRKQKAREGKWNGGPAPFGYALDKENGVLVVDPDEAEIVKIIFDKFAHTDMGADSIANYLNDHGYMKNKNRDFEVRHFTRRLIMRVLDNPVYTGKIAYGQSVTEKVKGTRDQFCRRKSDDFLLADGCHDAIIDEETWESVREKRKVTGVKFERKFNLDHEHILSGIVKCPICGAGMSGVADQKMYRTKNEGNNHYGYYYYRCKHRKPTEDGRKCDFKLQLREEELDAEVVNVIVNMVKDENVRKYITARLDEKVDTSHLEKDRQNLRLQLKQANGAKAKLMEQMDMLDVSDRHYNRKYQDMQDRLDNMYDRINELESALAQANVMISDAASEKVNSDRLYEILLSFESVYGKMTDAEKKQFMKNFIKSIEIYPERTSEGRILKKIEIDFPVSYDTEQKNNFLPNGMGVETVVLMSRKDT